EHSNKFIEAVAKNRLLGLGELEFREIEDSVEYAKMQNLSWLLLEIYANLILRGKREYLSEIKKIMEKSENKISNYKVKLRLSHLDDGFRKDSERILKDIREEVERINLHFNPKIYEGK
ncbi:MAG: hypothetical protein PHV06_02465, partial [bacterium]|nr:hypothetical protein [bacterium]